MKLTNEELDSILDKAGLELAQPYDEKGKYLKGQYLFTRCKTCGTQAHYRLKYILDKNDIGEKVCRACYWTGWYADCRVLRGEAIQSLLSQGYSYNDLVKQGVMDERTALRLSQARDLAEENGFDLIDLISGKQSGDDLLLVKCRACGKQTVERPGDVVYGCTCKGKGPSIS